MMGPMAWFSAAIFLALNPAASAFVSVTGKNALRCTPQDVATPQSSSSFGVRRHVRPSRPHMSLAPLVDSLLPPSPSPSAQLLFVGGKGGVGKTTVSSALAVHLASLPLRDDARVLVLSTDPAHSLGDALDVPLSGSPRLLDDPLTGGRLSAAEVDPSAALDAFRDVAAAFDPASLADALGVDPGLLEGLGLDGLADFLTDLPPGLDEFVALADVLGPVMEGEGEYDIVVVDTAPTGHTLRMLQLPEFLDGFLGKLLQLRAKLSGLASTLQALLGGGEAATKRAATVDNALSSLEKFRDKVIKVRSLLADPEKTSFLVVTVPTALGAAESTRLVTELDKQQMKVSHLVANQCVGKMSTQSMEKYYAMRQTTQKRWLKELQTAMDEVSASEEYQDNTGENEAPSDDNRIVLTQVPYFDTELVGVPALSYLGNAIYRDAPSFQHLIHGSYGSGTAGSDARVIISGGKGGVGKTTSSAALALAMAGAGHAVALISTDPAHSTGDALGVDLAGGEPVPVPLPPGSSPDGSLAAAEVDPAAAVRDFRRLVDDYVGGAASGGGGLADALGELGGIFDTLPAGADEVVALAKVVGVLRKGGYDRIVLDTAPTGHTLRMLSTPAFLANTVERVLEVSKKVSANPAARMLLGSAVGSAGAGGLEDTAAAARSALLSFQLRMYDLEDTFGDAERTEFMVVTVPTELATRETVRLVNDLTFESPDLPIRVRNVVANQVLPEGGGEEGKQAAFLEKVGAGEVRILEDLEKKVGGEGGLSITKVKYLDAEPRGVYGLKALSMELLKEQEQE